MTEKIEEPLPEEFTDWTPEQHEKAVENLLEGSIVSQAEFSLLNKMARLHLAEASRKRAQLGQLGEEPVG